MSTGHRHRSLLLTLCAFMALLLINGSAIFKVHAYADALPHGAVNASLAAASTHTNAVDVYGTWQPVSEDDASCDGSLFVDDELLHPLSVVVALNYFPAAAPLGAGVSNYPEPVVFLLQPPDLA